MQLLITFDMFNSNPRGVCRRRDEGEEEGDKEPYEFFLVLVECRAWRQYYVPK